MSTTSTDDIPDIKRFDGEFSSHILLSWAEERDNVFLPGDQESPAV